MQSQTFDSQIPPRDNETICKQGHDMIQVSRDWSTRNSSSKVVPKIDTMGTTSTLGKWLEQSQTDGPWDMVGAVNKSSTKNVMSAVHPSSSVSVENGSNQTGNKD